LIVRMISVHGGLRNLSKEIPRLNDRWSSKWRRGVEKSVNMVAKGTTFDEFSDFRNDLRIRQLRICSLKLTHTIGHILHLRHHRRRNSLRGNRFRFDFQISKIGERSTGDGRRHIGGTGRRRQRIRIVGSPIRLSGKRFSAGETAFFTIATRFVRLIFIKFTLIPVSIIFKIRNLPLFCDGDTPRISNILLIQTYYFPSSWFCFERLISSR
jgi:hypothetical protein